MSEPNPTQSTVDLLDAITTFADECRRRYRAQFGQPTVWVLHPADYDLIKRAVEGGTAPDWLAAEFGRGQYIPAGRLLIDEAVQR